MCIGFPMRVVEGDDLTALCERRGEAQAVSMLLVGAQPPETHVLVHLGSAVRVLDPEEARLIDDALDGLAAAMEGRNVDAMFADLVGREPELPEHLRGPGPDRSPDR